MHKYEMTDTICTEDTIVDAEKLIKKIAKFDPRPFLHQPQLWNTDVNVNIQNCGENHDKKHSGVDDDEMRFVNSSVVAAIRYYELVSTFAKLFLCVVPDDFELPDDFIEPLHNEHIINDALSLIMEVHQKWINKEDLYLSVPQGLDPTKKQTIESHLHSISKLNPGDESEGTLAYLLHDYCRTMITYDCTLQFTYGADFETVRSIYGEYTAEAFEIFSQKIDIFNELANIDDIDLV